tara:strand:- start:2255 stop:3250 length:996 start_codon:yes stop_codon:yes gene_type:complete
MSGSDIADSLQHPRRSLGDRHRSQSQKYVNLALDEQGHVIQERLVNLEWGEQSARQAVLHDFTNAENWKVLVRVKSLLGDSEGIRSVLEDLFSVLGRKPEHLMQLENIDFVTSGYGLLLASIEADPLDPDVWWNMACESQDVLTEFLDRTSKLDLRDRRANLLFSRRIERVRDSGDEDQFIRLSKIILAQRPTNHEAWASLGRMHERRKEYSDAWLCYDQAQICFPVNKVRDEFRSRMEAELDGKGKKKWKSPGIDQRVDFLRKMEDMATPESVYVDLEDDVDEDPIRKVEELVSEGKLSEAFFMTRRMAAQGVEGALEINQELRKKMEEV